MNKTFEKGITSIIIVILVILVLGAGGYIAWTRYGNLLPGNLTDTTDTEKGRGITPPTEGEPTETPPGTPKPIKQGVETYNISQAQEARPRIAQATFDPHDPSQGQSQNISVRVLDDAPVNSVSVSITSDNNSRNISLSLAEGTNQDGVWQGSWQVDDSIDYTYIITITASGAGGQSSVDIGIRRPN